MTITISEKEYDAICFAVSQIEAAIEGAEDEDYLDDACIHQSALYRIMDKYKKARSKAREYQYVRAVVAIQNRGKCLRPRDIDTMARKLLRKMKESDDDEF